MQLCIATSAKPKTAPTAALTFTNRDDGDEEDEEHVTQMEQAEDGGEYHTRYQGGTNDRGAEGFDLYAAKQRLKQDEEAIQQFHC
jgi:hypothetical protein